MLRSLLSGLLLLAFAAEASAQATPPATVRHTTQQQTTRRTTSKPGRTTVRKSSTKKMGLATPANRTGAVVTRNRAAAAPEPASGKGQGVYAAPGEPVNIQGATSGYDGAAPRRAKAKTSTTLTPTPTPTQR